MLDELDKQIEEFERRVKHHEMRGRFGGTYDHWRLEELIKLRNKVIVDKKNKVMEVKDGKQDKS